MLLIQLSSFNSYEWPRENFSLQYQYNIKQTGNENKERYHSRNYKLIQNKILQMNITRTVQETVRRITNKILGGKVLSCLSMKPSEIFKINAGHVMCVCVAV